MIQLCSQSTFNSCGCQYLMLIVVYTYSTLCSFLSCISPSLSLHLFAVQVTPMLSSPPPPTLLTLSVFLPLYLFICLDTSVHVSVVESATKMSLPVNSEYLSLERIARYRHACSNGSPYATNKPIDIKPRGRRG